MGIVEQVTIDEGQSIPVMRRVKRNDGVDLTQAVVHAIDVTLHELTADAQPTQIDDWSIDPEETVFDSLQTDKGWEKNSDGFNFRYVLPGEDLEGGRSYLLEIITHINPVNDDPADQVTTRVRINVEPRFYAP